MKISQDFLCQFLVLMSVNLLGRIDAVAHSHLLEQLPVLSLGYFPKFTTPSVAAFHYCVGRFLLFFWVSGGWRPQC